MENVISQPHVPGDEAVIRKSVSYHPTVWGDYFILQAQSSPSTQECDARMQERAAELMEQVRSMFKDTTDILQTMDLVDSIQLLGLSYHFDKEISEALNRVHDADFNDHALYDTALRFRLLRQQGYHVTPDVFNKFKVEEGNLVSTLKDDPKGLLSLYNAAYLRIHEETILDEAISFTRDQLASMLSDLTPPLATQVRLFLESPLCRRMKRVLARNFISIYQECATRNDALLELAKLDFNLLQCLHRDEIKSISIWWNDLFLSKNLSFARDRVVECYYWMLTVYFEPHYSRARVITTKVLAMTSILDDIYDLYSTAHWRRVNYTLKQFKGANAFPFSSPNITCVSCQAAVPDNFQVVELIIHHKEGNKHSHMFAGRLETRGQTHRPTDGKALHEIDCGTRRPIMSVGSVRAVDCAAIKAHNTVTTEGMVVELSFIPTQLNTSAHNHLYFGKADATALPSSRNTLS
nr:PREDICTED: alpha-humulene synthase-like [Musa acuminata subsp. malaccensis]